MIKNLQVIGYVQYRPVAKSHFVAAPWSGDNQDDSYLPSAMTEAALAKSCAKASDPLKSYPPEKLAWMMAFGLKNLQGIWFGENVRVYEEALRVCNLAKSAGFPWYYWTSDKYDCLIQDAGLLEEKVRALLAGADEWLPFTLTLKDELRTRDRVEAEKTRAFNASGFVHLLSSKMLFGIQNEKLMDTLGQHPVTIGVSVPGQQFVSTVLSLGKKKNCFDADGDGCDQRFNLSVARVIRDLRKAFLPVNYHVAVNKLYDDVYGGSAIACGVVHRLLHNKSGWENTGMDNSLYFWLTVAEAIETLTGLPFEEVCRLLVNGDDLALSIDSEKVGIVELQAYLAQYGVMISFDCAEPRAARDINFLSHHLRERHVPRVGDVLVAAGNRAKLMASINWVKVNPEFSWEECCVLHLLGLRLCLWPWKIDFDELEERLDEYLKKIEVTPSIRSMLQARLSEKQICDLHFRVERGGCFFPTSLMCTVLGEIISGITLNNIVSVCQHENFRCRNPRKPNAKRNLNETKRLRRAACKTTAGLRGSWRQDLCPPYLLGQG